MKMKHWMLIAALSSGCLAQDALADEQLDAAPKPAGAPETVPLNQTPKKSRTTSGKRSAASKPSSAAFAPAIPPAKGDIAVPRQNGVNIRGRTSVNSELVTRLKKDDKVKVLDEINLKNPKADEPSKWLKVSLPSSAGVWVNTSFIDANSKAVVPNRLNLRGGPSENYPVVGRVNKGTIVKPLETKGEWTKIEAPEEAFGYVAAHLMTKEPAAPPPTIAAAETPKPPVVPPPAPPVETTVPPVTPPAPIPAEPVKPGPEVAVAPPAPIVPPPITAPPPPITPPPTTSETTPPAVAVNPPPTVPDLPSTLTEEPAEDPNAKRIVTREGIVRRSVSIQAPSYFVLENLNGKPIDYLHNSSTNVSLKNFFGKHIIVTGEELLDERWPNMPVISVETLEQIEEPPTATPATPAPDGNK